MKLTRVPLLLWTGKKKAMGKDKNSIKDTNEITCGNA